MPTQQEYCVLLIKYSFKTILGPKSLKKRSAQYDLYVSTKENEHHIETKHIVWDNINLILNYCSFRPAENTVEAKAKYCRAPYKITEE